MAQNYYPKVFIEECKYITKEEVTRYITKDLKISSDSDKSDEE